MFLLEGWIISPDVNGFFDCSEEVLVFPCQYTEIINRYSVTRDVNMVMYGEGAFRCSLNLSPKFLADSPMYSSLHSSLLHLNLYMNLYIKESHLHQG